jgi:hypothetical protein
VHLRRALLLFAIVLGLAALAASVSRPRDEGEGGDAPATGSAPAQTERSPTVAPGTAPANERTQTITFAADGDESHRLEPGRGATVLVEVEEAGQVEIPDLGLTDAATPVTPARFEVFGAPGRYEIRFTPAGEAESRAVGTLAVTGAA